MLLMANARCYYLLHSLERSQQPFASDCGIMSEEHFRLYCFPILIAIAIRRVLVLLLLLLQLRKIKERFGNWKKNILNCDPHFAAIPQPAAAFIRIPLLPNNYAIKVNLSWHIHHFSSVRSLF
jgi:hypothetical protein